MIWYQFLIAIKTFPNNQIGEKDILVKNCMIVNKLKAKFPIHSEKTTWIFISMDNESGESSVEWYQA